MLISLDTECTGLDFVHGAKPFLVTTCDDTGEIRFWEWPVDPMTRQPEVPQDDLVAIAELLDAADLIYMQNSKFDTRDRKSTRLNSSHIQKSRMPSSA